MNQRLRTSGNVIALSLIIAGTVLFLDNLGVVSLRQIGRYWPVVLVIYGLSIVYCRRTVNAIIVAGTLIAAGILLILGNLGVVHANAGNLWPLVLIMSGVLMMMNRARWEGQARERIVRYQEWRKMHSDRSGEKWEGLGDRIRERRRQQWENCGDRIRERHAQRMNARSYWAPFAGGRFSEVCIFSSSRRQVTAQDFRRGEAVAVLGSVELDLTEAQMQLAPTSGEGSAPARRAMIDATAVFGSIEITVPRTWRVVKDGAGVFGAYEDLTVPPRGEPGAEPPTLVVRGAAVFGSVEVKN